MSRSDEPFDREAIIAEYDRHIESFVAKRYHETGGMPLCPFAAGARLGRRITYEVGPFDRKQLTDTSLRWARQDRSPNDILIFLDPRRDLPILRLKVLETELRIALAPLGWVAFHGHPASEWQMAGIYTRRDPFPSLRVYARDYLKRGEQALERAGRYYGLIEPGEVEEWETRSTDP